MATKGVLIDFNKKYITVDGFKVLSFEKTDSNIYPIRAFFKDVGSLLYTNDGFYWDSKNQDDRNLILIKEGEDKMSTTLFRVYEGKGQQLNFLRLANTDHGVELHVVNEEGIRITTILRITPEGKLCLMSNISKGLGISVDSDRKIEIE